MSETPAQAKYGQADYWYLMYQMTRLPEAKIKAILDEPQWRLLSRQFMQARGWSRGSRAMGLLVAGRSGRPSAGLRGNARSSAKPTLRRGAGRQEIKLRRADRGGPE